MSLTPATVLDSAPAPALGTPHRPRLSKACVRCSRIKCKCIRTAENSSCERCLRLNKTCEAVPRAPRTRRTSGRTRGTSSSHVDRLEARINDLVDIVGNLQATQKPDFAADPPVSANSHSVADRSPNALSMDRPAAGPATASDASRSLTSGFTSVGPSPPVSVPGTSTSATDAASSIVLGFSAAPASAIANLFQDNLSQHEAREYLRRFRDDMVPLFPFVYISPEVGVDDLRQSNPMFWLCICAAASINPPDRNRFALAAHRAIIETVVEKGERNLDILLGLLTFMSWAHLTAKNLYHRRFTSFVSQMAVAIAWDLGLTAPPLLDPSHDRFAAPIILPNLTSLVYRADRTLEERRAVLGVFSASLVVSHMFRSAEGLRWSPYLESCVMYLEEHSTIPQDLLLVQHIKIQVLVSQVRVPSYGCLGTRPTNDERTSTLELPYIDTLRVQLDEIVGIPSNTTATSASFSNYGIQCMYYFTSLVIHESALVQASSAKPPPSSTSGSSYQQQKQPQLHEQLWVISNMRRFKMYQHCLGCAKAWIDNFTSRPVDQFSVLPTFIISQAFYVIVSLHRLLTLHDPVWNLDDARSVIDLFATLDRVIHMCEKAYDMLSVQKNGETGDVDPENVPVVRDIIGSAIRKLTTLRMVWQSEMAGSAPVPPNQEGVVAAPAETAVNSNSQTAGSLLPSQSNLDMMLPFSSTLLPSGSMLPLASSAIGTVSQVPMQLPSQELDPMLPPSGGFPTAQLDIFDLLQNVPELIDEFSWT